jgi:hypothetical protein
MKKDIKKGDDWIQKKWRPMMAVMYMAVCIFDFIIFPIMFTIVQFWEVQAVNDAFRQWQPITLLGGGLFHVAMGAVLGVTAWSRGQEKIAGASTNLGVTQIGYNTPTSMSTTPSQSSYDRFINTADNNFSKTTYQTRQPYTTGNTQSDESENYSRSTEMNTGVRGRKAPMQADDPVI